MVRLSLNEISHVIALATAPAFLLGGVVALLALLVSRLARVVDRVHSLDDIDATDERRGRWKAAVPHLRRRARLIHYAMGFAILSGIMTALLVVLAFLGALLNLNIETPIATFFIVSLLFFIAALSSLALEVGIALGQLNALGLD